MPILCQIPTNSTSPFSEIFYENRSNHMRVAMVWAKAGLQFEKTAAEIIAL